MRYLCAFFLISFIFFLPVGCKKEAQSAIPDANVDVYIYINNPSYISLTGVGGWAYVNGGVRGIIVYRKTADEFMSYERNCTFQSTDACATVIVDKNAIMASDSCCGSQFLLTDGSVLKTPAAVPLKQYRNTFDGNVLHIYN
ncbi:MAG TPA: hypothetical protein PK289_05535 [Bacteroidia bacterium]|jgi:nitrite reductase/ring-hydroxylating ferredoxin subunit|nr:hypothetical protein [Bacteroidia bacterium]HRG53860.1 hypothetical protein [Bacteroidia bacterium]